MLSEELKQRILKTVEIRDQIFTMGYAEAAVRKLFRKLNGLMRDASGLTGRKKIRLLFFYLPAVSLALLSGISPADTGRGLKTAEMFFGDLVTGNLLSDFEQQRYLSQSGRLLKSEGFMKYSLSEGLCWSMRRPFKKAWLFNNSETVEFAPGKAPRRISGEKEQSIDLLIELLNNGLSQNGERLLRSFEVVPEYTDSDNISTGVSIGDGDDISDGPVWNDRGIYLIPQDKRVASLIYRIYLAKAPAEIPFNDSDNSGRNRVISTITIMEHDGGYTRMIFKNQRMINMSSTDSKGFCYAE